MEAAGGEPSRHQRMAGYIPAMRTALLALALCLATASANAAESFVTIGKPGKVDIGFIGCKTKDNLSKIKSLFQVDDREAMVKLAISKVPDCQAIKVGTVGMIEGLSAWSGDICLRPEGEPECFWLPTNFVVAP
jgi:hypothetical protein